MKKRGKKKWIFLGIILLLGVFWWYENFTIHVTQTKLTTDKLEKPVKVALLSDLHGQSFGSKNISLLNKIDKEMPDLIAVTGDMFTSNDDAGKQVALDLIAELATRYPVYFVPGEHDNKIAFFDALQQAGVKVLRYEQEEIELGGGRVVITGIDNMYYSGSFDLNNAFDAPNQDAYQILLAHIENFSAFAAWGADLSLCGDTHGGIIQLPFLGPVNYNGMWFPELNGVKDEVYDRGLFKQGNASLYVSAGLGNYPYPVRLFNRPELAILTITPKS